eukprot:Skav224865  [mRNA]  locus=scaffold322:412544:418051:+ [translate_table: standard]
MHHTTWFGVGKSWFMLSSWQEDFVKSFERPLQKAVTPSFVLDKAQSEPPGNAAGVLCLPESGTGDREAVLTRLRGVLGPFMLRRLKEDKNIAPELPDKVEYEYLVEMTQEQAELYTTWTRRMLHQVQSEGTAPSTLAEKQAQAQRSALDRRRAIFTLLHRLQQVVNHPAAMPREHQLEEHSHEASKSGKMMKLVELLQSIWEDPEQKVLIFTQYRDTQQLLAEVLQDEFPDLRPADSRLKFAMYRYVKPSGGVHSVAEAINDFSGENNCRVLILTLKAGWFDLKVT